MLNITNLVTSNGSVKREKTSYDIYVYRTKEGIMAGYDPYYDTMKLVYHYSSLEVWDWFYHINLPDKHFRRATLTKLSNAQKYKLSKYFDLN